MPGRDSLIPGSRDLAEKRPMRTQNREMKTKIIIARLAFPRCLEPKSLRIIITPSMRTEKSL